ncbi:hypothetical protein BZA70DRAFT_153544 [Myxozyma melibiosi]|uniref:Uncharacterized protein n=1 Tax=Myxozyma melibiosi TaxID=54550 RepID=A0ABR1F6C5_9ASCO
MRLSRAFRAKPRENQCNYDNNCNSTAYPSPPLSESTAQTRRSRRSRFFALFKTRSQSTIANSEFSGRSPVESISIKPALDYPRQKTISRHFQIFTFKIQRKKKKQLSVLPLQDHEEFSGKMEIPALRQSGAQLFRQSDENGGIPSKTKANAKADTEKVEKRSGSIFRRRRGKKAVEGGEDGGMKKRTTGLAVLSNGNVQAPQSVVSELQTADEVVSEEEIYDQVYLESSSERAQADEEASPRYVGHATINDQAISEAQKLLKDSLRRKPDKSALDCEAPEVIPVEQDPTDDVLPADQSGATGGVTGFLSGWYKSLPAINIFSERDRQRETREQVRRKATVSEEEEEEEDEWMKYERRWSIWDEPYGGYSTVHSWYWGGTPLV